MSQCWPLSSIVALRWPSGIRPLGKPNSWFERRCAPVPSFLTGTRDVGRAPSQALPPRPGRLAQELWEGKRGRRERAGRGRRGRTGRKGRREGAGLSLDCVKPRARTATCRCGQSSSCEDSLQKPCSWTHTVILRPEPFVAYRTFGLAVALLGVLSGVRRPLAQLWDAQHDVDFFSVAAGAKANSIRRRSHQQKRGGTTRQPLCFWLSATFYDNVGHATDCRM